MIYLASPYTYEHEDRERVDLIQRLRFETINRVAAILMLDGVRLFSPISHCHPIALVGDLPVSWAYWEEYDREMLSICEGLIVLMLPGWQESTGVQNEIKISRELGIPVQYIDPIVFGVPVPDELLTAA